jgi:hypothetical protein
MLLISTMKQKKALLQFNSNLLINDNTGSIITALNSRQRSRIITKVLDHISKEPFPIIRFLLFNPADVVAQTDIVTA